MTWTSIFTYHNSKSLFAPFLTQCEKEIGKRFFIAIGSNCPLVWKGYSPIVVTILSSIAIGIGIVIMELNRETIWRRISGNDEIWKSHRWIASIWLHDEVALGVITSCSTNSVNKRLIETIGDIVVFLCRSQSPVTLGIHLIQSGKGKTTVIISESCSYVCP